MRAGATVVLVLTLGVAGCSDSSEATTTTHAPTTATVAATTAGPAPSTTTSTSPTTTTSTTSQPPAAAFAVPSTGRGSWQRWSTTNDVRVRGIALAPNGDIWATTHGGLVHWKPDGGYTVINDPEWPDPAPYSIAFTPDGDLWLGFYNDVLRLTPTATIRHEFAPQGESSSPIKLAVGPDGDIWAAADQLGVQRFDGERWLAVVSDLPGRGDLNSLAVDAAGWPWLGSYWSGLWVLEDGELRQETALTTRVVRTDPAGDVWYKVDDGHVEDSAVIHVAAATGNRTRYSLGSANVWDIAPIDGAAYVGTDRIGADGGEGHGLWLLEDGEVTPLPGSWDALQRQVLAVVLEDADTVWLGGQSGVWRYDGKSEDNYATNTFSSFMVNFVVADDDGSVWVGDCDRSSIHDANTWRALPPFPEASFECDTTIDGDGRLWIAGFEGIAHLDGEKWVLDRSDAAGALWYDLYPPCDSEACEEPRWSLAAGTEVWAGMIGVEDGLWRRDGGEWRRVRLPGGAGALSSVTTSSDGSLWVAASNGVHHWDGNDWASHPSGEGGPPANLRAIAAGGDTVWVRSNQELAQFDGDTWNSYPLPDGFWWPRILLVDPEGAVWLPSESGATRFDTTTFTNLESPAERHVYAPAIAMDPSGAWWLATGRSLHRWVP